MAVKPEKSTKSTSVDPILSAANIEWERLRTKIEKKISSRKAIPTKKGEVKKWVNTIAREVIS